MTHDTPHTTNDTLQDTTHSILHDSCVRVCVCVCPNVCVYLDIGEARVAAGGLEEVEELQEGELGGLRGEAHAHEPIEDRLRLKGLSQRSHYTQ